MRKRLLYLAWDLGLWICERCMREAVRMGLKVE